MSDPLQIGFLVFPNVTQLDLTGPVQVFSSVPGSMRFQIRCNFAPGTLENTCTGPVRSSWVTFGNTRKPI